MKHRTIFFNIFLIVFSVVSILFPGILQAQDEISPIQFHGSNRLYYQYSNREGTNQEVPAEFWREDFNTTLSIYGIPISASFFLTSEQSDKRQSINNFRIYFNPKEFARQKATAYAQSKTTAVMANVLSLFSTLEVGRCRPHYTPLTVSGISVTGANIEFTPGIFYSAFSMGKTKKAIKPSATRDPTFEQNLLFVKIGVGKKQSSHFYFTYLHVEDDKRSLSAESDSFFVFPQENYLVGTEADLVLFNKKFKLESEAVLSVLTRNVRSADIDLDDSRIPSWLNDLVDPKISTSMDYAYRVKSTVKLPTTKLSGGVKMIGSGFTSLGAPNLRNDILTYDGRIDQNFLNRQINFSTFFKQSKDNLIDWKKATTTSTAYGISYGLRFRNYPYLQVNYTPNFQKNDSDTLKIENKAIVLSVATGYSYSIGNLNTTTSFNFFFQNTETETDTLTSESKTQTYTLSENVNFKFPLSLAGAVSLSMSEYSGIKSDILTLTFNAAYRAFKKWRNTLGVRYSDQDGDQIKTGIFWSSKLPVWKLGDLDLRVEENFYRDKELSDNDYDEFVLKVTLTKNW